jgi:hypothetical protein
MELAVECREYWPGVAGRLVAGLAAIEPVVGQREHLEPAEWTSWADTPQMSPPSDGGTTRPAFSWSAAFGKPQWSPPSDGGSMSPAACRLSTLSIVPQWIPPSTGARPGPDLELRGTAAAIEPFADRREHGDLVQHHPVPGALAMEPRHSATGSTRAGRR